MFFIYSHPNIRDGPYKFILGVTRWWTPADDGWLVPPEMEGEHTFNMSPVISQKRNNETCCFFPEAWNRQLYHIEGKVYFRICCG